MKKNIVIGLLTCMIIMCGCSRQASSVDPVAQRMIEKIDSIGIVELDDEELINQLFNDYATLTENQKDNVTN